MMQLSERHSRNARIADKEFSEASFIPYYSHWDSNTIVTKKNEFLQVIKIEGFSFETADDEDVDMAKNARNALFKSVAAGKYALWFHIIRRKEGNWIDSQQPVGFARKLDQQWKEKHRSVRTYTNELYITVIQKPATRGVAAFEHFLNMLQSKADKTAWELSMKNAHKDIQDLTKRMMATLREYRPHLLGIQESPQGNFSEILEFLGTLVNGGARSPMMVPTTDISHYLPTDRLYFGERAIELRGATQSRFAGIVSVKEYPPSTSSGILDAFLQLPHELIISQSYIFSDRQVSIGQMKRQQMRMVASGDVAVSQATEISDALDMAMSGQIGFGNHHLSVMCIEDNLKSLEDALSMAYGELVNIGANPVRETLNLQATYFAQLPANFEFFTRSATINTLNLAGFASLHNYPIGHKHHNHWGDAVTVFDTTSGTPFFFNFHVRDVGHTTIIGPTGAGKTVLMNFLCAQAQKFNGRLFFFDKDRGAEIFIRAVDGVYSIIETGKESGFNPLQLDDTPENRAFLVDWLMSLVTTHNATLTPEDIEKINEAVNGNYKLPKEHRRLANIAPFLGIEGAGKIASRLKLWHSGESHSKLFDNPRDSVDFSKSRVFGFEMGEVLRDKISLGPVLLYLFHKISLALDGTPTMIVLDEAWALIDNPVFAPKIKDWLKTLRKLNAMVIFATQSVEDASKSAISDTLIQQTATQIFLPNPKATDEYRKTFMLTEREFTLIKTTNPGSRFFLVKQGSDVVVARIDLTGMADAINVLSGRAETVGILDEVRAEVGDDPDNWLPVFYERARKLR